MTSHSNKLLPPIEIYTCDIDRDIFKYCPTNGRSHAKVILLSFPVLGALAHISS